MAQSCTKVFHFASRLAGIDIPLLAALARYTLIQTSRNVMMIAGAMKLFSPCGRDSTIA